MGCIVLKERKILGLSKIFVQKCIFHSFLVHVFRLGCFAVVMKPALPLPRDLFRTQALTTDYRRHHLVLLSVACSGYHIIYVLNLFFYWYVLCSPIQGCGSPIRRMFFTNKIGSIEVRSNHSFRDPIPSRPLKVGRHDSIPCKPACTKTRSTLVF
jgi:hypothetical protein